MNLRFIIRDFRSSHRLRWGHGRASIGARVCDPQQCPGISGAIDVSKRAPLEKTAAGHQPSLRYGAAGRPALRSRGKSSAFTLLEVMFAVMAFCTATFAILALVSQSLDEARRLQRPIVDTSMVASVLSLTNKLTEGTESGDLGDMLGDSYKGYTYTYQIQEVQTNRLFEADVVLQNPNNAIISKGSYLFYRPLSPAGSLDGATVAR